jgi:predicted transcriptional regulator
MESQTVHPTGVKLDPTIKVRLKKLGKLKHRTIHWLMKEAILQYLAHEERAEKLKKETLARWQEAEQNRVVSNKSVMTWLDTWGTDHEVGRPSCDE